MHNDSLKSNSVMRKCEEKKSAEKILVAFPI